MTDVSSMPPPSMQATALTMQGRGARKLLQKLREFSNLERHKADGGATTLDEEAKIGRKASLLLEVCRERPPPHSSSLPASYTPRPSHANRPRLDLRMRARPGHCLAPNRVPHSDPRLHLAPHPNLDPHPHSSST